MPAACSPLLERPVWIPSVAERPGPTHQHFAGKSGTSVEKRGPPWIASRQLETQRLSLFFRGHLTEKTTETAKAIEESSKISFPIHVNFGYNFPESIFLVLFGLLFEIFIWPSNTIKGSSQNPSSIFDTNFRVYLFCTVL